MSRGPRFSSRPIETTSPVLRILFEIIAEKNIPMEEVANEMGCNTSQLWQWRAGRIVPRFDTVERLADAIGAEIDVFCMKED